MIAKILIVAILGISPALAINKCTSKYTVGYQQSPCPATAIKSESYIDKVGAPARNPSPRYAKRSGANNKPAAISKKSKTQSPLTKRHIEIENNEE